MSKEREEQERTQRVETRRRVNSFQLKWSDSKGLPKRGRMDGLCSVNCGVEERRIWGEAIAEAVVDCIRVRMPE